MAFGAGTLIAALALVLMEDAHRHGGLWPAAAGFIAGAGLYTIADTLIKRLLGRRRGARRRAEQSGLAIACGSLIDNVPEGIVIGIGVLGEQSVSPALLAAVFLSNLPEALASSARMRDAGHRAWACGRASDCSAVLQRGPASMRLRIFRKQASRSPAP
jgi:ZIP family zinc transporter